MLSALSMWCPSLAGDLGGYRAALPALLPPASLIMEATVWKSLLSDCNPVVSIRPLVVPAGNILWGRENILIQTLHMSFLCKGSFFSHPDRATGMPSSLWLWCLTGQGPQLGGEISSVQALSLLWPWIRGNKDLKRISYVKGFCCLYFFKCKLDYFIANLKINDFILIAKHFGDLVPPCGDFWCPRRDCHSTWSSRK